MKHEFKKKLFESGKKTGWSESYGISIEPKQIKISINANSLLRLLSK